MAKSRGAEDTTKRKATPTQHTIATQISAALCTSVFYPIDVVKVRFMSQDGTTTRSHNGTVKYASAREAFSLLLRDEGFAALFRGVHVAVAASVVAWGVYMFAFRSIERLMAGWLQDGNASFSLSAVSSVTGSCLSSVITNPLWVIKSRMQLEEASRATTGSAVYKTFLGGVRHAIEKDGLRSLWRGFSAQVMLSAPQSLYFPMYDAMKRTIREMHTRSGLSEEQSGAAAWELGLASLVAKGTTVIVSHPMVVVKTRLHDHRSRAGDVRYLSAPGTLALVFKREGFAGAFRGIQFGMLQALLRTACHTALYEAVLSSML